MLLTAKELRQQLSIPIELWNYWKIYRRAKHHPFPTPDGTKFMDKNHPNQDAWEYTTFKVWWENRPRTKQLKDITLV